MFYRPTFLTAFRLKRRVAFARVHGDLALARDPAIPDADAGGRYLLLTYFSRRMCDTGSPWPFSASKQVSTMFGLPHR